MKMVRKTGKLRVKAKVAPSKIKTGSGPKSKIALKAAPRPKAAVREKLASKPSTTARAPVAVRRSAGPKRQKPAARVTAVTRASRIAPTIDLRKKSFRSRASMNGCSRRKLVAFAEGRMDLDEKLDVLYHLDRCQKCWDDLYLIRKSKNGQLYSRRTRNYTEADIKALEKESAPTEDEDMSETESAFGVA